MKHLLYQMKTLSEQYTIIKCFLPTEHLPKHGVLAEMAKCHLPLLATASMSTAPQFTASGHVTFKQVTTHCNCTLSFIDFEQVSSSYLFSVCCLLFDCLAIVCSIV